MTATLTREQKHILAMSKAEYLSYIGRLEREIKLQVAAAIFRIDFQTSRPSILLLKRREHHIRCPGVYEVPTGKVDDSDFIISDSIARAVEDQISLRVFRIEAMLRENQWLGMQSRIEEDEGEDEESDDDDPDNPDNLSDLSTTSYSPRRHMQLNWAVTVNDIDDTMIKGDDHEEYMWASWE